MKFEEVTFEDKPENYGYKKLKDECPNCKASLYYGEIPCPERRSFCAVLHYGYRCFECGKIFKVVRDD